MTALVCFILAAAAPPNADFDAFFAEFAKRRDGVQTLDAKFVQETITPDDPKPIRRTGTITYAKPRRIIFHYDDPELTYLVDAQKVYEYNVKATQLQIIDLENDPQTEAFFLGFDDNTTRLKQAYTIALFTPEAGACGTKGIELTPMHFAEDLTKRERKPFEKVRISLDGAQYLPCFIEIINDKESKNRITISDIKVNANAAAKELTLSVPEGVDVFENDEKLMTTGPGGAKFPRPTSKTPSVVIQELKTP